jgi:signal transduction histidine kinase
MIGTTQDVTELRLVERERLENLELLRRADRQRAELLHRVVDAQEQERARIAANINDDPLQKLTAVTLRLQALQRTVAEPESRRVVDAVTETVQASIASLRSLLFDVRPRALDHDGLGIALLALLDRLTRETGVRTRLDNRLDREPAMPIRVTTYRVLQEALDNVKRHAAASRVDVVLEWDGSGLHALVRDDGCGISSGDLGSSNDGPSHMGITSMQDRVRTVGGRFDIHSEPGAGTTVQVWIPSQAQEEADPRHREADQPEAARSGRR